MSAPAGRGAARKFKVAGLKEGLAWAPRQWTKVTADTGTGNPANATAEKGARYFDAVCADIANFLVDLDHADLDDMYGDPEETVPHR